MMDNMTSRLPESLALVLGACVIFSSPAFAQGPRTEPKITLRTIMQELGAEFLQLSNSLMIDDFNGMDEAAKAIQGHPLPGGIATAIKNKLGKDFSRFESVDQQSHQAAAELVNRAAARDALGSAKAFGHLTEGCVSCHAQFRQTLRPLSD